MAYKPLTFHPRCGSHAEVTEGGKKFQKSTLFNWHGSSGVLTARPLRTSELFEIEIISSGNSSLSFGITTHSPEKVKFPSYMRELKGVWFIKYGEEQAAYSIGGTGSASTIHLKRGDTLSLQVTRDRKLCYYMNGKDVDKVSFNIPDTVYGFVDLYHAYSPAVKLIPHVLEKVDISTAASLTPKHEKEKSKLVHALQQMSTPVRKIAYSELEFGDSLGIGRQGAVFKGQWKTKGLAVAIKRVLVNVTDQEANILHKLSHPNVITFYGICTERYPEYFIITELAEDDSLYTLIHEKHYHPEREESVRWVKEIAEGMKYLHQQKVIHRDLKSRNVLLKASGTMKICDFGSAKEFDHTTIQTGTGTYRWIAPEVLKGEKVSLSCDVFSYGMVLFEIFKEELPFAGIPDVKVIGMISEGKTPAIPVSLEPYLANLMKCCWLMNAKGRPSFPEILIIMKKKKCPEPMSDQEISGFRATEATTNDRPSTEGRPTLHQLQVLRWNEEGGRKEMRVMRTIAPRWRDVGIAFGLDPSELNSIETSCLKDVRRCTELVMTTWLEKGKGCTWKGLMGALEDAEFSDLAVKLQTVLSIS